MCSKRELRPQIENPCLAAFRYGPYVCHMSLVPHAPKQKELASASSHSSSDSFMVLRDGISEYYSNHAAEYVFRAQFVTDLKHQPVEDASTAWDEFSSPWHDLAIVKFPPQATYSDARRAWWDNKIALSPFNGLSAQSPLGSVNRLRKRAYSTSRKYRAKKNGGYLDEPYFPKSIEEMPE